jgi:hypothetical protein
MSYFTYSRTSDAGPEPTNGPIVLDECQNCRKPSESLTMLGNGWDFLACDECARECIAADAAEAIEAFLASKIEAMQVALFSAREVA